MSNNDDTNVLGLRVTKDKSIILEDDSQNDAKIFSQRLNEIRFLNGLSQKQIAESIGVSPAIISAYTAGKKSPTATVVKKIAIAYGVSMDWLYGVESEPEYTVGDFVKILGKIMKNGNYVTESRKVNYKDFVDYKRDLKKCNDMSEESYLSAAYEVCLGIDTQSSNIVEREGIIFEDGDFNDIVMRISKWSELLNEDFIDENDFDSLCSKLADKYKNRYIDKRLNPLPF